MICPRCRGLMLGETLVDMEAGYHEMWSRTWRCVNCGHRADPMMQPHQQAGIEQRVRRLMIAAVLEESVAVYKQDSVESLAA
ncbi:MAG: hypothetical protein JSR29_09120 [Nitrospira sp.]|nr:hypothetical protein [Nitrospira sp.]